MTDITRLPKLYDVDELAAYLKCSADTVRREVQRGRLGCTRIGKALRFTETDPRILEREERRMPKHRPGQVAKYWLSKRRRSAMWYRTYFDAESRQTKRASLGTSDFQEAQALLIQWVAAHAERRNERAEDVALEEIFIAYYQNHARHLTSADQARHALAKWTDFFAGASVTDVTPRKQEVFVQWMRDAGCSDGYIARILAIGRAALNRAYKPQEIQYVPFIMSVPGGEPRERRLRLVEAAALFDATDLEHLLIYLMVAFNTLARPKAILELKRFQVNLEDRLIEFNPPGRRQTKKYRPAIPITRTLYPWLERLSTANVVSYSKEDRPAKKR